MAIAATTNWEFNASATGSMVNGGGFNTANANFLTDATTDSNTANTASPVLSSATYNFVAGDANAWVYISSGTNWTPGFYKIASVASNKATLSAAIGAAVQFTSATNRWGPSTVVGCATVGTPTNGVFGVDYSQTTGAVINAVADFAAVGASTTLTSATAAFTPVMVGNHFHQTTTGTGAFGVVGWYEIVSYVNATTVVLDRTPNSGTASVGCTGYVGGALDLAGTLQDSFLEQIAGGNNCFFKNATFTLATTFNIASTNSTAPLPSNMVGYNTIRGDEPTGANRPIINLGTVAITFGQYQLGRNFIFTGTAAATVTIGLGSQWRNINSLNTSTSAGRRALVIGGSDCTFWNCEAVSQNGTAFQLVASSAKAIACYAHDSDIGIGLESSRIGAFFCLCESNKTAGINCINSTVSGHIINNTIYGSEAKIGTGINFAGTGNNPISVYNNIIYGHVSGMVQATTQQLNNIGAYNDFFNNTTDVTLYTKDPTDIALDPGFTGLSQLSGSTATTSTNTLTQTGAFASVTNNVDYLRVVSGTGATAGIYLITSHTNDTVTVNNSIGTNATADKVWVIPIGHNLAIGTNLKAKAFPGQFQAGFTTGYLDTGAVQRQEPTSGSGGAYPGS